MMVQEVRLKVVFVVECSCEAHKPCHKADRLLIDFAHSHMKRKSSDFSTVFLLCCSRSRCRIAQLLLACTQVFLFCVLNAGFLTLKASEGFSQKANKVFVPFSHANRALEKHVHVSRTSHFFTKFSFQLYFANNFSSSS